MVASVASPASNPARPDPEVRPHRRVFTGTYKLKILDEIEAVTERGGVGAILRREGLYASHVTLWRKELRRGGVNALGKKRGRRPTKGVVDIEVERLRRENEKLSRRLAQAEAIIDVQKKVASLLGVPLKTSDDDESDS